MVSQVHVLGGVRVVQQLSVTRIHQVDAELHQLLHRSLWDHVGKLSVLREGKQQSEGQVLHRGQICPVGLNNVSTKPPSSEDSDELLQSQANY